MGRSTNVLFHLPYALTREARIAPQIRPRRMISAFRQIGCTVIVVSGDAQHRREQMRSIRHKVRTGALKVDLVYSESAGWPNAFSDEGRSFHPNLDALFLKFIRRHGIPVSLFYRDAYHRSHEFFDAPFLRRMRRHVLRLFAEHDLRLYNTYVDLLYLPSLQMRPMVPEFRGEIRALPPGGEKRPVARRGRVAESPLRLLYVGGLGNLYRLHALFRAVDAEPSIQLTICTREDDWLSVASEYAVYLQSGRINIVHRSGDALLPLYEEADVAVLSVEPNPYRDFAVPVKLYEYVGHGKPILASSSTLSGEYVAGHDIGWTVAYSDETIRAVLSRLATPAGAADIDAAASRAAEHANSIGWDQRARQVLADIDSLHLPSSSTTSPNAPQGT